MIQQTPTDKLMYVYNNIIQLIVQFERYGACHDTSAMLYVLAKEIGFNAEIFIGEVYSADHGKYFDHSWVSIDGFIYDPAIGYPLPESEGGKYVCGPVYASIDITAKSAPSVVYASNSPVGLGEPAITVSTQTLAEYDDSTKSQIWSLSSHFAYYIGISVSENELERKYGGIYRTVV
ncbi:TPA: acetyltransferase [Morganella morganii]|nr:acetyltransferase [Morganella morganii]